MFCHLISRLIKVSFDENWQSGMHLRMLTTNQKNYKCYAKLKWMKLGQIGIAKLIKLPCPNKKVTFSVKAVHVAIKICAE